jgi:hypothetical protein
MYTGGAGAHPQDGGQVGDLPYYEIYRASPGTPL